MSKVNVELISRIIHKKMQLVFPIRYPRYDAIPYKPFDIVRGFSKIMLPRVADGPSGWTPDPAVQELKI